MKKIVLAFVAMFFVAVTTNAALSNSNSPVRLPSAQNCINLGNITGLSADEIDIKLQEVLSNQNLTDLTCSVSVKGELDLGFITFEISVTVSGPCDEVKKSGKKIALDLLQQVKAYLQEVF